jgi:hypothetical protein
VSRFERIASWVRENGRPASTPTWLGCRLVCDDRGVTLIAQTRDAEGDGTLAWGEVERAVAFCWDALVHDLVCIKLEGAGRVLVVNEEMAGFHEFARELPQRLPGARAWSDWFPALANATGAERVIFERTAR